MLRRRVRQSSSTAFWGAYLLLCGGLVFAGAMLQMTGSASPPPRDLQAVQSPPAIETPVARIQFLPDRDNLCRALMFHNDTGRYQEGGIGQCTIPRDMATVWNVASRAEAFSQAFRSSWKGDALASSLR